MRILVDLSHEHAVSDAIYEAYAISKGKALPVQFEFQDMLITVEVKP